MYRGPEQIEEEGLVLDAQRGDSWAMQALAVRWHRRLIAQAYRRTGQPDGAAEAVQDAWVAIVRGLRSLDDPARFRSWAYRIVDRKAVDWVRKRRKDRERSAGLSPDGSVFGPESDSGPQDQQKDKEPVDRLRQAFRRLPDETRSILSMFYVNGLSVHEIAEALTLPEGTVKSRLFHARRKLRALYEADR